RATPLMWRFALSWLSWPLDSDGRRERIARKQKPLAEAPAAVAKLPFIDTSNILYEVHHPAASRLWAKRRQSAAQRGKSGTLSTVAAEAGPCHGNCIDRRGGSLKLESWPVPDKTGPVLSCGLCRSCRFSNLGYPHGREENQQTRSEQPQHRAGSVPGV